MGLAAQANKVYLIALFIKYGGDVNMIDPNQKTGLMFGMNKIGFI